MTSSRRLLIVVSLAVAGLMVLPWAAHRRTRHVSSSAPLTSEAYVWQQVHTSAVADALTRHGPQFACVVVLAGQITWHEQTPTITRVDLNWPALAQLAARGTRIGLALRVGELRGEMSGTAADVVAGLAQQVVEAVPTGISLSELQIDFDCPTRRLGEYAGWLRTIRQRVHCPITITALPTWLSSRDFRKVADDADGFVLQVHSIDKPQPDGAASLCDIPKAVAAIEKAGELGKPFRVALPTYGCLSAFDKAGRLVGLSAEGPPDTWPAGIRTRQIVARPDEIAGLVRSLRQRHPASLQAIIFYRMPVAGDRLNWPFCTLQAVMQGHVPSAQLRAMLEEQEDGLRDVLIENAGTADSAGQIVATVTLQSGHGVAADALVDFAVHQVDPEHWQWEADGTVVIRPGERRRIGWIRTSPGAIMKIRL